jgi:hypothetical protein
VSDYFVFGGCLRSELDFPDLSPAYRTDRPDWVLHVVRSDPPQPIELRGTREIEPGWDYRLFRVQDGFLLEYGGSGSYAILSGGREIVWYPGTRPENSETLREIARAIVLGPVMALALHQSGVLCLHGSAVSIGEKALAFLAPKHHGKSTLALALAAAGARLLTDDLVAIDLESHPVVRPGVHSVRVMGDVAERLGPRFSEAALTPGYKTTVTNLPRQALAWDPAPLAAIYLPIAVAGLDDQLAVSREALAPARAAAALAREKKLTDGLVGLADAGSMLEWIASVTAVVPVYRLAVLSDLERLPDVVRQILAWHGATPTGRDQTG